jgi:hypothetical protein
MRTSLSRAILVAAVLMPTAAYAQSVCEGRFEGLGEVMLDDYDPFAAVDRVTVLNLDIRNTGAQDCQYKAYFIRAPEFGAFGSNIEYALNDGSGSGLLVPSELALETANFLVSSPLAPSVAGQLDYAASVPRGQYSGPGEFDDTVTVILTQADHSIELDRMTLRLRMRVKSVLDISLLGGGIGAEVDFGELAAGQSRTLVLQAYSNEEYRLSLVSENNGALKHSDAPQPDHLDWSVPYLLSVDGAPAALDSGGYVVPGGEGSKTGRPHQMIFTILDASNKRAGFYSDTLTVRIVPKL